MKKSIIRFLLLGLFLSQGFICKAGDNPKIDCDWKLVSKNDSFVTIQFGVRSTTLGETIGNANFVFDYDQAHLLFAKQDTEGEVNIDYFWHYGFEPKDTTFSTITRLSSGRLSINIHFESMYGANISSDTAFTPIVDVKFRIIQHPGIAAINMHIRKTTPPLLSDIFDENFNSFEEGDGWGKPFVITLEK